MNTHRTAIVVGAGITGIGASYHLGMNGISHLVLERKNDLGGVWSTQRWHGARCDSDIIKYSFSFKPFLSKSCLQYREEIHRYLHSVAEEFGILGNIRFDTRVEKAVFNIIERRWFIYTNNGVFTSQYLFNGNGYFSDQPHVPVFVDAEKFNGEIIHASELDGKRTFGDKDVVLVGSGATATTCAPQLSLVSKSLTMVQRSPSYIYEISNDISLFTGICQELYRHGIQWPTKILRYGLQLKDDMIYVGFRRFPRVAKWIFKRHWVKAVGQECFERHFSPRYKPWEQRVPIAIGMKEKIRNGTLKIRTSEIARFTESSIVLKDGGQVKCDVCVLATGYDLEYRKFEMFIDDERIVMDRLNFYKGVMMGAIPNYFHPFGVWHSAWTERSEAAIRFAIKIIRFMTENNYQTVTLAKKSVDSSPGINPGYIERHIATLPRFYGSFNLPSVDRFLSFRFKPSQFRFS